MGVAYLKQPTPLERALSTYEWYEVRRRLRCEMQTRYVHFLLCCRVLRQAPRLVRRKLWHSMWSSARTRRHNPYHTLSVY